MAVSRQPSATDVSAIAADGFVFGYPLVLADLTRTWMTAVELPDPQRMRAPANRFVHARALPEATAGDPAGALRSSAWLDLGATPAVLSVPETHGRFYCLSLVDLWTDVFASVGARTTGTGPGTYVIAGPAWNATAIARDAVLIRAPTRMVRIAGSTLVDGGGYAEAHAVQDGYDLRPLAGAGVPGAVATPPAVHVPPTVQVERMDASVFFSALAALLRDNPPRLEDRAIIDRMRRVGLLSDDGESPPPLSPAWREAVAEGAARGLERVLAAAESPPGEPVGSWHVRFRLGAHGTDYLRRAAAACAGLESGPAEDELPMLAQVDASGRRLTGRRRYEIAFPEDDLPPVHGYWTLMTYDAREPLVDNPVERYSIGDWNGLVLERDGSLRIRIQHADPGAGVPNWLPSPPGEFNLALHLWWPQQHVLDRRWTPPAATPAP
jgi:hypothetical protein